MMMNRKVHLTGGGCCMRKTTLVLFVTFTTFALIVPANCGYNDDNDDEDYYNPRKEKEIGVGMIIFLVLFFGAGIIGACIGVYCRFCGGADAFYGEPVTYVYPQGRGRAGVYVPNRLLTGHGEPPTVEVPNANQVPYGQPQPYGFVQGPPPPSTYYSQPLQRPSLPATYLYQPQKTESTEV